MAPRSEKSPESTAAADAINQISPIPESVVAVVHLYHEHLGEVVFPDVDSAALDAAVDAVLRAEQAEQAAREALARARAELAERDEALYRMAQRALAYARVFADGQPELAARVDTISLRRRPRKKGGDGGDAVTAGPPPTATRSRPRCSKRSSLRPRRMRESPTTSLNT
ncbi:MAG: hypothetical protein KC503_26170 [Myxococcales bacterium]|nr:hypothetical protein [Myxococcales bacterium]